jgi:hypothetical protein
MENELPKSDKIFIWGHRHEGPVDESLIPPGKEPGILDIEHGLNMKEVYDPTWTPE